MNRRHQNIAHALACGLAMASAFNASGAGPAITTVYVGRHFEVRDHDQPAKYVFNGDTRVVRITGSLSSNSRLQRLRLQTGWNHCSTAVGGAKLPMRAEIVTAFQWNPATGQYLPVGPTDSLAVGTVLWIKASAPAVISLSGSYVDPTPTVWPTGAMFVGSSGQEAMPLVLPAGVTIWRFDAATQSWQAGLAGDLGGVNELPPRLAPGEAIYVHSVEPVAAPVPDPAQRIAYYHPDHLGSSSVVSDAEGVAMRETTHHPFGVVRHEERWTERETHFGFTQKERDAESRLHYFEARYLAGPLARFLSVDPKFLHPDGLSRDEMPAFLTRPQKLNPLAYARNNPVNFNDPTGLDEVHSQRARGRPAGYKVAPPKLPAPKPTATPPPPAFEVELVLKDGPRGAEQRIPLESFSQDLPRGFGNGTGQRGEIRGRPQGGDFQLFRKLDQDSGKFARSWNEGTTFKEATVVVRKHGLESMRIRMEDLSVTGRQIQSSASGNGANEVIDIQASKIEVTLIAHPEDAPDRSSEPAWKL